MSLLSSVDFILQGGDFPPFPGSRVLLEAPGAPLESSRKERASLSLTLPVALIFILQGLPWAHAHSLPITIAGGWDALIGVARSHDLLLVEDKVSFSRTMWVFQWKSQVLRKQ